ncbi:MAG: sulfurtransferase [Proteobacteria bacterium]|nr:sulfurtransferase [Pseudomonadota bacterium]
MATSARISNQQGTIISAETLSELIDEPGTVVIDCRWYLDDPDGGKTAFVEGHIPGARYASLDDDLSGPPEQGRHPLPTPEAFAETCASLGISASSSVVAYDDRGGAIAARLWWMLANQGHLNVFVLDGGIQAWTQRRGIITTDQPAPRRGSYPMQPWVRTVTRDEVLNRDPSHVVIDARSIERYRGDEEPIDSRAGHIPGARSMPMTGNLDEDITFRPSNDLRDTFALSGITADSHVISHCGSGVTACHNILAMAIAGMDNADLYVGSWSDWSTAGYPVATGDETA